MDNRALKDQQARDIIAGDIRSNLMVEAGAGTGKTEEMAKRILALVSGGYRSIEEIVAITFTRKAANELRERVRSTLEKEYLIAGNLLIKRALEHMHECFIGTIHSFCERMLRERPVEAGVDPGFEEIDEAKDQLLRQKTWETFVMQADEADKGILHWMSVFGVNEAAAKDMLKTVCEQQDVNFVFPGNVETGSVDVLSRVKVLLKEVRDLVYAHYGAIPDSVLDGSADGDGLQRSMMNFYGKTRDLRIDDLSYKVLIDLLMIFSTARSLSVTQKNWGAKKEEKAAAKELGLKFQELRDMAITPLIEEINVFVYDFLLVPFSVKAKDLYLQHKRVVAQLNFQDLLIQSSRLLRDFPEVRRYFQEKYKTLLIDEFQDTDPIQAEIAMFLTGKDLHEKRWNKLEPREGSLFVVGDPKQSIYGFRRADFQMYRRFREHIESAGGKVVELRTNFRSTDKLGEWYNDVFSELLCGEDQAVFAKIDTVTPTLEDTLTGAAYYRIDEKIVSKVIASEPEALSSIIRHIVGRKEITVRETGAQGETLIRRRPVQYRDIMVLAMKKKLLEQIANGVAASGIPVRISGADITKRTSEFASFADLIRMLAYPEESAYLYDVMRGDFFNLSDADIFRYHDRGGEFSIYFDFDLYFEKNRPGEEDGRLFKRTKDCFHQLRRFSDYVRNLSPAAAAERVIEDLGIMRIHLTSNEKRAGLGSFVSLIEKIRLKKITDIWGLNLFIDELAFMIENGFEEDLDLEGSDVDAVRFMNVHKAKGLEAPIVILGAPCSGERPAPTFYTERVENKDGIEESFGYKRVSKYPDRSYSGGYFEPRGWGEIEGKAQIADQLERDRLLYVAATRARNYLVIGHSAAKNNPWAKLLRRLPEERVDILEEVHKNDTKSAGVGRETILMEEGEIGNALQEIKKRRDEAFSENRPTYRTYVPSAETGRVRDGDEEAVSREREEKILEHTMEIVIRGEEIKIKADKLAIGTVVHRVMETLITNEPGLGDTIRMILEESVDEYITEDFLCSIASGFRKRPLWGRIQKADKVYTETPFSYKAPAGSEFAGETLSQDTYVNGIIDLVFKEPDGWTIIDYKTYDETEISHEIRAGYEKQLDAYKEVWERITGEPVIEKEIFFIRKRIISDELSVVN